MIRQYLAHTRRGGCNPLGVGVTPVGAIFYIQDEGWWRARYRARHLPQSVDRRGRPQRHPGRGRGIPGPECGRTAILPADPTRRSSARSARPPIPDRRPRPYPA